MESTHLLIYSHEDEPITRTLRNARPNSNRSLLSLSIKEILDEVEIFDRLRRGQAEIQWTLPDGRTIHNHDSVLLINRVIDLPRALFQDFIKEDRDYAFQEFWAYLSFALASFSRRTATPTHLGLVGAHAPLPIQWQWAQQIDPSLGVPAYYFGPKAQLAVYLPVEECIIGSLYSSHLWRTSQTPDAFAEDTIFAYQRPKGVPVVVFVCGDSYFIETQAQCLDEQGLADIAIKMGSNFATQISEQLYFFDGKKLSFGSLRPTISKGIAKHVKFHKTLQTGLKNLSLNGGSFQ